MLGRRLCLSVAVLAAGACASLVDETGHPCSCGDGYVCCNDKCLPTGEAEACKASEGGEAGDATSEAVSDSPSGAHDSSAVAESGSGDACGIAPSFAPSGGIDPSDLSGCGLISFTLTAPPAVEGGGVEDAAGDATGTIDDGEAGDGGASIDTNPADTLVNVDTGEISQAGNVLRPPTAQPSETRDVQAGIAYRINSYNVAVFTFGSLAVPQGATLKLIGSHAVAIVSASTIRIDGVLEARPMSGDGTVCAPAFAVPTQTSPGDPSPGATAPGGYPGGSGGYNNHYVGTDALPGSGPGGGGGPGGGSPGISTLPTGSGGGGGGGHAGVGGSGAVSADGGPIDPGGTIYDMQPLDSLNFHGGAGGGGGGGSVFAYGGAGGSGGGAVRVLAAVSITMGDGTSYGGINASGCGGAPGVRGDGVSASGGGGAGGAIVIESPHVQLGAHASLLAAGGGGGVFGQAGTSPAPDALPTFGSSPSIGDDAPAPGCGPPPLPGPPDSGPAGWPGPNGVDGDAEPTGCAGGGASGWIRVNAGGGYVGTASGVILAPMDMPWFTIGTIATQ